MKRLVLIDGHAILHRAFHALPPNFVSPKGLPTNAIHGFTNMLLRVISDLKPDYLAVAFDLPAPNFRQQIYTQYQDKRPEMQGNLKEQIGPTHELLSALNIAFFEVGGFEADDVLGTLAKQAVSGQRSAVSDVYIVTGDRDMLQLVNDRVKLYVPVKGLKETKTYDVAAVNEEFGVKPEQWVDVKALKGDASDNYPGVAGIGPKTACELIGKFGTLEELFGKLDKLVKLGEIKESTARKLAEGAEGAGMAKKLAQIVTDVPGVHLDLDQAAVSQIDWLSGVKFMREELGMRTTAERILASSKSDNEEKLRNGDGKDHGNEEKSRNGDGKKHGNVGQMRLV